MMTAVIPQTATVAPILVIFLTQEIWSAPKIGVLRQCGELSPSVFVRASPETPSRDRLVYHHVDNNNSSVNIVEVSGSSVNGSVNNQVIIINKLVSTFEDDSKESDEQTINPTVSPDTGSDDSGGQLHTQVTTDLNGTPTMMPAETNSSSCDVPGSTTDEDEDYGTQASTLAIGDLNEPTALIPDETPSSSSDSPGSTTDATNEYEDNGTQESILAIGVLDEPTTLMPEETPSSSSDLSGSTTIATNEYEENGTQASILATGDLDETTTLIPDETPSSSSDITPSTRPHPTHTTTSTTHGTDGGWGEGWGLDRVKADENLVATQASVDLYRQTTLVSGETPNSSSGIPTYNIFGSYEYEDHEKQAITSSNATSSSSNIPPSTTPQPTTNPTSINLGMDEEWWLGWGEGWGLDRVKADERLFTTQASVDLYRRTTLVPTEPPSSSSDQAIKKINRAQIYKDQSTTQAKDELHAPDVTEETSSASSDPTTLTQDAINGVGKYVEQTQAIGDVVMAPERTQSSSSDTPTGGGRADGHRSTTQATGDFDEIVTETTGETSRSSSDNPSSFTGATHKTTGQTGHSDDSGRFSTYSEETTSNQDGSGFTSGFIVEDNNIEEDEIPVSLKDEGEVTGLQELGHSTVDNNDIIGVSTKKPSAQVVPIISDVPVHSVIPGVLNFPVRSDEASVSSDNFHSGIPGNTQSVVNVPAVPLVPNAIVHSSIPTVPDVTVLPGNIQGLPNTPVIPVNRVVPNAPVPSDTPTTTTGPELQTMHVPVLPHESILSGTSGVPNANVSDMPTDSNAAVLRGIPEVTNAPVLSAPILVNPNAPVLSGSPVIPNVFSHLSSASDSNATIISSVPVDSNLSLHSSVPADDKDPPALSDRQVLPNAPVISSESANLNVPNPNAPVMSRRPTIPNKPVLSGAQVVPNAPVLSGIPAVPIRYIPPHIKVFHPSHVLHPVTSISHPRPENVFRQTDHPEDKPYEGLQDPVRRGSDVYVPQWSPYSLHSYSHPQYNNRYVIPSYHPFWRSGQVNTTEERTHLE